MLALFGAGFAVFAQVFAVQAMFPSMSAQLGVPPATASLTVSATSLGLAVGVLPWTWVADRIGRVAAMKYALVLSSVVSTLTPLVTTIELIVVARFGTGVLLGAVPAIAMAYLAEELDRYWLASAAGIYIAGNSVGGVLGRLVAGFLSEAMGWRIAMAVLSAVAIAATILFLVVVPVPRGFTKRPASLRQTVRNIVFNLRDPIELGLFAQGFFLLGAFTVVYNYLGYHVLDPPFNVPPTIVSVIFVAYLFGTLASRFSGVISRACGYRLAIFGGTAFMTVGALLMLAPNLIFVLLGLIVITIGCFTVHPITSRVSGQASLRGRSQATALYQLSWLTGTSFFGWAGGLVYEHWGWGATVGMVCGLCVCGSAAAVLGLVVLRYRRPHPGSTDARGSD